MPFVYTKEKKVTLRQAQELVNTEQAQGLINTEQETIKKQERSFWKSLGSFVWETLKVVIISLAIVIPVRYFIIQPFYVKGASMEPNFYDHEYLIIDEISYRFRDPKRGEVVIFKSPQNPRQYFIKRVIALPGEKIEIKEKEIFIFNQKYPEGIKIDESKYLPLANVNGTLGQVDITLRDNEYFVLGDNRNSSLDSRSFGPITRDKIMGQTWLRGWPFDRFELFKAPGYNL
jgi:signal peptidase I